MHEADQRPGRLLLSRALARRLRAMIESGEVAGGTRLPSERDLSARFGVSRSAVREAIAELSAAGLIEIQPGRGSFVIAATPRPAMPAEPRPAYPALDLCRFRHMLEGQAARLAAMRVTDAQLDEMALNLRTFREQVRAMALQDASVTDFAFHSLIVEACGVRLFADLHASHRDMLTEIIRMPRSSYNRAWEPVVEHERILEAFRRRDPEEARYYVQSHIVRSAERLGVMFAADVV